MGAARNHDATGRSIGRLSDSRLRKQLGPPPDQPWVWLTCELIESFAWRALTDNGHKMMNRILIEHMNHGRILNGALPVTYADFVDYGIRRNSVLPTIAECEALGLIERIRGQRARAQFKGSPQRFRICWLPTADGEPAKFAWRRFTNLAEAAKTVADARKCSVDGRSCGRRRTRHTPFKGEMEI